MSCVAGVRRLALLVLVVVLTGCSTGALSDVAQPTSSSSVTTSSSVQTSQMPVSTSAPVLSSAPAVTSSTISPTTAVTPTLQSVVAPPPPVMPAAAPPVRLQYPAVGIDVSLEGGIDIVNGGVNPPTLNGVYYIRGWGLPGEGSINTTFIAGHASQNHSSPPFNGLSDSFAGSRGAKVDDIFTLTLEGNGQLSCLVEQVIPIGKDELSNNPRHEVWRKVPNRVVLFSCYIAEDNGVTRNVDVIARCGAAA